MNYYRILADHERFPDAWFLGAPLLTDRADLDAGLLTDERVEVCYKIRNGKRVEVRMVPMENLRYPLSVYWDGVREVDAREFTESRWYTGPLPGVVPIRQEGRHVSYHLGALDMPVVTMQVGDIVQRIAPRDVQCFPVTVGQGIRGYEIMNSVHQRMCVDEALSDVRKWGPEDHRADLAGRYREIRHLIIDPQRTEGSHVFRLWGYEIMLIVSEDVKCALEGIEDLGVVFQLCSGRK